MIDKRELRSMIAAQAAAAPSVSALPTAPQLELEPLELEEVQRPEPTGVEPPKDEIRLPPGPRRPAMLQMLEWTYRPIEFMERCRREYGPFFSARLGPMRKVVFLSDPEDVRTVFTADPDLLRTGDINGIFRPIIGSNSILQLDGSKHMQHRRLLLPAFHGRGLENYRTVITDIAERQIAAWPTDQPFAALPRMHKISTEVIMRVVFGVRSAERLERLGELLPRFMDLCQAPPVMLPFLRRELGGRGPWARLIAALRELDALIFDEIRDRRIDPETESRSDVLSLLVQARYEDGSMMSDNELRDELITLLVAGHETTSGALALAVDQIVHDERVRDRLASSIAAGEDEYLDAVIKESLRRRPVLPIVGRKLSAPFEIRGYTLPRGTVVLPSTYLVHHEPDVYPDPYEFRPERFLEADVSTYAWIPFGGGIRRCVGAAFATLQMKIVVRTMLERLEVRAAGRPEPVRRRSVSVAPKHGARIAVSTRGG